MKKVLMLMLVVVAMALTSCKSLDFIDASTTVVVKAEKIKIISTKVEGGLMVSVVVKGFVFECGVVKDAPNNNEQEFIVDDYEITKSIKFKIGSSILECKMKE